VPAHPIAWVPGRGSRVAAPAASMSLANTGDAGMVSSATLQRSGRGRVLDPRHRYPGPEAGARLPASWFSRTQRSGSLSQRGGHAAYPPNQARPTAEAGRSVATALCSSRISPPQRGAAARCAGRKAPLFLQMISLIKKPLHGSRATSPPTSRAGCVRHARVRLHRATRTSVSTRARGSAPRVPLHGVGVCYSGYTRWHRLS
jgi:hypothetical protein